MCEFISAVKTTNKKGKDKYYFLTHDLIHNTPSGELLCKKYGGNDLIGHSAIREYFELRSNQGANWECTDFSTPNNFPAIIVKAIKRGEFKGLGTPKGLLTNAVNAKWRKERDAVYAKWQPERDAVNAKWQPELDAVYAKWQPERDAVYAKWQPERDAVYAKWQPERDAVYAKWQPELDAVNAKWQPELDAVYAKRNKELDAVYAKRNKERDAVYAKRNKERDAVYAKFWDLFAIIENRATAWR